jgi:hypothetical protein
MVAINGSGASVSTSSDVKHIKIGTFTRSEINFLKCAVSTDKTRTNINNVMVRYSDKINGFVACGTDTHRAHCVILGNLFNAPVDVEITLDVNAIARQMSALKLKTFDLWCAISPTGEFIGGQCTAYGIDNITGSVLANGNFPHFEFFIQNDMHIDNTGFTSDVNGNYLADAVSNMAGSRNDFTESRVRFWQDKSKKHTFLVVLDHHSNVHGNYWNYGRCFAVIMPMSPVY